MRLPVAVPCSFFLKRLEGGFSGLERDDFSLKFQASQMLTEQADVCTHVDYKVDAAIFDEVEQIACVSPADLKDSKPFIDGPYDPVHDDPSGE